MTSFEKQIFKGAVCTGLLLLLTSCSGTATVHPSINDGIGTLTNGNDYTITGSGFGEKNPVEPKIWDDFDSETPGLDVPYRGHGEYWEVQEGTTRAPSFSNTMPEPRVSGDVAVLQDYSEDMNKEIGIMQPWINKMYISFWVYRDNYAGEGDYADNGKIYGNWNSSTGRPILECSNNPVGDVHLLTIHTYNDEYSYYDNFGDVVDMNWNRWFRLERWVDIGTLNQPDGLSWIAIDNDIKAQISGVFNSEEGYLFNRYQLGNYFAQQFPLDGETTCIHGDCPDKIFMRQYLSEAYADTTLARIEICNDQNKDSATHCEVQIPKETWNDTTVKFTANKGSFTAGEQLYLFVINPDGNANGEGLEVKFN